MNAAEADLDYKSRTKLAHLRRRETELWGQLSAIEEEIAIILEGAG